MINNIMVQGLIYVSFVFSFDVKTSVKIIDIQRLFIITADRPNRGTTIDD